MVRASNEQEALRKKALYFDKATENYITLRQRLYSVSSQVINTEISEEDKQSAIEELSVLQQEFEKVKTTYAFYLKSQYYQAEATNADVNNLTRLIKQEQERRVFLQEVSTQMEANLEKYNTINKNSKVMSKMADKFGDSGGEILTLTELKQAIQGLDIADLNKYFSDFLENKKIVRKVGRPNTKDAEIEDSEEYYEFSKSKMIRNTAKEIDEMVETCFDSIKDFQVTTEFNKQRWTSNVMKIEAIDRLLREIDSFEELDEQMIGAEV